MAWISTCEKFPPSKLHVVGFWDYNSIRIEGKKRKEKKSDEDTTQRLLGGRKARSTPFNDR